MAQSDEQGREVAFGKLRLLGVEGFLQAVYMARLVGGTDKGVEAVAEGDQSGFVFLADGDVGEYQGGIDGIVEQRHAREGLLHHAPLVDNAVDGLRAFLLILVHHELVPTGRGSPVNGAVVVAGDVVLDLLEVGVVAYAAYALQSHLVQVVAHGQQFVLAQHQVAGVDFHLLGGAAGVASLH